MLLEQRSVSHKTPLDGKLEISPAVASRLATLGAELMVASGGREQRARLEAMTCACEKGRAMNGGEPHTHHFVEAPILKELAPGADIRLDLDETRPLLRIDQV